MNASSIDLASERCCSLVGGIHVLAGQQRQLPLSPELCLSKTMLVRIGEIECSGVRNHRPRISL
jgi:hypothetical protein